MSRDQLKKLSEHNTEFVAKLFDKLYSPFVLWLLQTFYLKSQKYGKFLFQFSKSLKLSGVSFSGLATLHNHALSPSVSSFKEYKNSLIHKYLEDTHTEMQQFTGIFWLDNYNLFLKYTSLNFRPYENCNWTAFAIEISPVPIIKYEMPLTYNFTDKVAEKYGAFVKKSIKKIKSFQLQYQSVLYSPPIVKTQQRFLENFRPLALLESNIGSNKGLHSIILDKLTLLTRKFSNSYVILKCDINIYYRILKVVHIT
jgi:hypothetical protein